MPRQEGRFDFINESYFPKTDGILLLFDVTSKGVFERLNYILKIIKNYFYVEYFPILLIIYKIDLFKERVISKQDIDKFQKNNKLIGYFEVSCKNNINIKESFDFLVNYIIEEEKKDVI